MYNDEQIVAIIKDYMAAKPGASRTDIAKHAVISRDRLESLAKRGLITIPPPLSAKQAAIRGRKISPWGNRFYLRGTPKEFIIND